MTNAQYAEIHKRLNSGELTLCDSIALLEFYKLVAQKIKMQIEIKKILGK